MHIWHPCSQMKDYETFPPLNIASSKGCYIELKNGQKIIDAISSWWCKSLGHNHPRLKKALLDQLERFEHVLLANTTHDSIIELGEKLSQLTSSLNKIFFASEGSAAIEIAMKMSLHARVITGKKNKTKFLSLKNGYHGETAGALSVSDVGIYRDPYTPMLMATHFISPIPYVNSVADPLWQNCETAWNRVEKMLEPLAEEMTAILVEPIVQGAGGMRIYSQDFLRRLRFWTKAHDVHLIADEIMTGFGRTGSMFACEHAEIEPDFMCLAKSITSGWLPLSLVMTRDDIYELFYDDYHTGKSFLHSHTHSGNALAVRVALEVINIFSEENICAKAKQLGAQMQTAMQEIAHSTGKLTQIRGIGAIVAADLVCIDPNRRLGFEIYQKAVKLGALLRPLGNTIYWLPPLNMSEETLAQLKMITEEAILS